MSGCHHWVLRKKRAINAQTWIKHQKLMLKKIMVNSVRVNLKNAQVFHRIYLHFEDLGELSGLYMKILKYAEKCFPNYSTETTKLFY